MSRICIRRFRLGKCQRISSVNVTRDLHTTVRCRAAVLLTPNLEPTLTSTLLSDPREIVKKQRLDDLVAAVTQQRRDPQWTWGCYIALLNIIDPDEVPLELHQLVLRKCTHSAREQRENLSRRLRAGNRPRTSHSHEVRFQAIIHNIRQAGHTPALDDYHYILRQFAAVGHHVGALEVLREISHVGLKKTARTYGLCLMALCHRLSLPIWHQNRPLLISEVTKVCTKLLADMWTEGIPLTGVNVDLALRVFKETMDVEGFERMMKMAYAVDFAYPDRPPLELWEKGSANATSDRIFSSIPKPLPFSTATLNTTIDILGRLGQVSRLVQAFEVLTTPLKSSTGVPASSFEDDEDEEFGDNNPSVATYNAPHAKPNTTTYHFLLKWISRAGHAVLARHYLLQAMQYDREVDRALRGICLLKPPSEIEAPHFGVNRSLILPVFAEANRDKNMELLRWVLVKTQRVLRRKRADLLYYSEIEKGWTEAGYSTEELEQGDMSKHSSPLHPASHLSPPSFSFSPLKPPSSPLTSKPSTPEAISPDLDLDLEDSPVTSTPIRKVFNIYTHLSILSRDKEQLEKFEQYVTDIIGRDTQRVKERLGRRIWGQKNIYLRSLDNRSRVSRTTWREIVNYRPTPARVHRGSGTSTTHTRMGNDTGSGHVAAYRGFFTSRTYASRVQEAAKVTGPDTR